MYHSQDQLNRHFCLYCFLFWCFPACSSFCEKKVFCCANCVTYLSLFVLKYCFSGFRGSGRNRLKLQNKYRETGRDSETLREDKSCKTKKSFECNFYEEIEALPLECNRKDIERSYRCRGNCFSCSLKCLKVRIIAFLQLNKHWINLENTRMDWDSGIKYSWCWWTCFIP